MGRFVLVFYFLICLQNATINIAHKQEQCSSDNINECDGPAEESKYSKEYNEIWQKTEKALASFSTEIRSIINNSSCKYFMSVLERDLAPYHIGGITSQMLKDSEQFGTLYKIYDKKLYRATECMFPARCAGIEHFLLELLPEMPDLDLVINTRDYPQVPKAYNTKRVVLSFSKTKEYLDIMYPAWTFWAGGPAISLFPTGIGRWDKLRESIMQRAEKTPWSQKQSIAFFRGSRTSDERDNLVLLSRRKPELVDAKYTKNQAWKSVKDTLYEEAAKEVSFEDHCQYKYLFNFRGVAASFRFKHLFLCNSLVFHVGADYHEFFYFALKPWVHYVPLNSYPTESELERILLFFREHDNLAQEIAQRGYEFVRDHLKMSDVQCYWRQLLLEYKKLLNFTVAENKNLIQIKS